jgi:serine protease AprX
MLSGTSVSAPVVAGAVALMLEANYGLTPAMVKAILQYTAQVLPGYNLLQQGAGSLNIEGAVRLAANLRNDFSPRIQNGQTIHAGETMLWWSGATLPTPSSVINGQTVPWGKLVFVGGNRVVTGEALFKQWQPFYDQRLLWANGKVRQLTPRYWPGGTYAMATMTGPAANTTLVTPGCGFSGGIGRHLFAGRQDRRVHADGQVVVLGQQRQDAGPGLDPQRGADPQRRPDLE